MGGTPAIWLVAKVSLSGHHTQPHPGLLSVRTIRSHTPSNASHL